MLHLCGVSESEKLQAIVEVTHFSLKPSMANYTTNH